MGRGSPWDEGPVLDSPLCPQSPAQGELLDIQQRVGGGWLFLCLPLVLALLLFLATSWTPLLHLSAQCGVGNLLYKKIYGLSDHRIPAIPHSCPRHISSSSVHSFTQ